MELLGQHHYFIRMDELMVFSKLLRSVGNLQASDVGVRLESLRDKLQLSIDSMRVRFEASVAG